MGSYESALHIGPQQFIDYLDQIINILKERKKNNTDNRSDFNPIIEYLQRNDVKKQFFQICIKLKADRIDPVFLKQLELIFIEFKIYDSNENFIGTINCWPCSQCVAFTYS